jgi:predicted permease
MQTNPDNERDRHAHGDGVVDKNVRRSGPDHAGQQPGSAWRESYARDARLAWRRLIRQPAFSIPVVLTLALALGATTAVFTVLDAVVLSPLPYPESGQMVRLQTKVPGIGPDTLWGLAKGELHYFQESSQTLDELALYTFSRATVQIAGSSQQQAEHVLVVQASANLVEVLGVRTMLGRAMMPDDNLEQNASVTWLSHGLWERSFGSDPDVVGRVIVIDGRPIEVAGVLAPDAHLPEESQLPDFNIELWSPIWFDPVQPPTPSHVFRAIGRLHSEASLAQAQAELSRLTNQLPQALPQAYTESYLEKTGFATEVISLRDDVVGGVAQVLWILLGAVALVMLVACVNVANLFLAQTEARRREIAVRSALGAGRGRLAQYFLSESLLVTMIAGAVGLLLAHLATRLLIAASPGDIPRLAEVGISWASVAFTALLVLMCGTVFGLLPLTRRGSEAATLSAVSRTVVVSRRQLLARRVLVIAQVALSLVLLAGAGLLFQSFSNLLDNHPGIDPDGILTFRTVLPGARYQSYEDAAGFYHELVQKVEALPGVEAGGLAMMLPLTGFDGCSVVFVEGQSLAPGEQPPCVPLYLVAPGFFETLGVPVLGDSLEWSHLEQRAGVAVASKALAERLWPGQDPIGHALRGSPDTAPYRIIGVAGDVRASGLDKPPVEALYLPLVPAVGAELWPPMRDIAVVVRGEIAAPEEMTPAIRRVVAEIDSEVPMTNVQTMREIVASSMTRISFSSLLLGIASGVALVLSLVGIYSILSYLVAQRRTEIGVRMALGAREGEVRRLVVMQSLRLAAAGVALGLVGAFLITRYLSSLLYEISPTDPLTLGVVSVALILLASVASWVPAQRATRMDPNTALRLE